MTNGQNHLMLHAEAREYLSQERSVDVVVRFGKIDILREQRNPFLPCQSLWSEHHEQHVGSRTTRPETTLLLGQDPHTLAVVTDGASNTFQQYIVGVCHQ